MMTTQYKFPGFAGLAFCVTVLLSACGGGTGSSEPTAAVAAAAPMGIDRFLLMPNPLKQDDGTLQIDSPAYATAYYEAIDPNNDRDTLAKFKAFNHIGEPVNGTTTKEVTIVIGDRRDLGYGRKMTGRLNADGTIAFVVDNFMVSGYGPYTQLNGDAAIIGAMQWHIGTNAIEYSPGPNGGASFIKFYTFAPVTETRVLAADLDGRGRKHFPTICVNCHGGRADPLTPPDPTTGKPLFPKLNFAQSGARGDVGGKAHAFEPTAFDFSTITGFSRSAMEANIKELNKMVLCTYPKPASEPTGAFDGCRRAANADEYQGTAAEHLKNMYGGNDLPNAISELTETYMPGDWATMGQSDLYAASITNSCRICHSVLGTGKQSDIDFQSFTKFDGYAERTKIHVIDRGNMPMAKLVYDKFWTTPAINGPLRSYLSGKGYTDALTQLPGHPEADPGPDRMIKSSTTTLSAAMSLFSTSYQWTMVSGNATLTNPTSTSPTFTALGGPGTYTVQLQTRNGTLTSDPKTFTILMDPTLSWDPDAVAFNNPAAPENQIRNILQANGTGTGTCMLCHASIGRTSTPQNPGTPPIPPSFYDNYDRAGTGNANDATNLHWLYTEVRGRINFTDIAASPLLRKPAGEHHNGDGRDGFLLKTPQGAAIPLGDPARIDYDKMVAWILRGAPEY